MRAQAHSSSEPLVEYTHDQSLTNQVMTNQILCFRLILEETTGKEIPKSSETRNFRKGFIKYICFIRCRRQFSGPLDRGCIAYSPLLKVLLAMSQKLQEPCSLEVRLFSFTNSNFGSFKSTFAIYNSMSEFQFSNRKFILLILTKEVIFTSD